MINPSLHRELMAEREQHLIRRAEESLRVAEIRSPEGRVGARPGRALIARIARMSGRGSRPAHGPIDGAITIRYAFPDDAGALVRLATLDSRELPPPPLLVAEVDGVAWAALSLADGAAISDPFRRTAGLLELLEARAVQLRGDGEPATTIAAILRAAPLLTRD
jgi:hypothetical protein